MKKLDLDSWVRKSHFQFFKNYEFPYFNITANLDVTSLKNFTSQNSISFFKSCLYFAMKVANEIEEFRYRTKGNDVIVHDDLSVGTTILNEDNTFSFCYFKYDKVYNKFEKLASDSMNTVCKKMDEKCGDDLIRFSAIPWVSFTSFTNARKLNTEDSVPIVVFGKYFADGAKIKMPVSVEVHHALMDGIHVGRYFELFQNYISKPRENML